MKKVLIIHGFEGQPNGGWRPWLMRELASKDVWACALPMPMPSHPIADEWVAEIARETGRTTEDEIFLVGHSLGVPAILRYLESAHDGPRIAGAVLVAGPIENIGKPAIEDFFLTPFDFERIRSMADTFSVIHAHDDANVPFPHAERLAAGLGAELVALPTGAHLNGSSGVYELPSALAALEKMGVFLP
jgi:predicted alpha/beta hydrolase family esterase